MENLANSKIAPASAVYIAALTQKGPEILDLVPKINLSQNDLKDLAYKSIPMGGKDGDSVSVSIQKYQAICLVTTVPKLQNSTDKRDTFVSLGLLLKDEVNPIPYRNLLRKIIKTCREKEVLCYEFLKKVSSGLIKSMTIEHETTFSVEIKKGLKIEFAYFENANKSGESNRGTKMDTHNVLFQGVLSLEETMKREKSAFVLDKTILKAVCSEGPLAIEDLRKKTLPLESVLGVKIDLPMIETIIERYVKQGLIKIIDK